MRRHNPYANRRTLSARQLRRAATPSPRQKTRIVDALKATAAREIKKGLADKIAEHVEAD
jgi:hypothetical protein